MTEEALRRADRQPITPSASITASMSVTREWWARAVFRGTLAVALGLWFWFVCIATYSILAGQQSIDLSAMRYLFSGVPAGIGVLFLFATFLLSGLGSGLFILKPLNLNWHERGEESIFAVATGLIAYTFLFLGLGTFGLLQLWVCYPVVGLGLVAFVSWLYRWYRESRQQGGARLLLARARKDASWHKVAQFWLIGALLFFSYLGLLGALSPETEFDGRWYHLGPANTYARVGDFTNYVRDTNMTAAALDVYQVVLYAVLWKFDGMIAAKLMHWGDAILTVLAIIAFCKIFFNSYTQGLLGAIIFLSTPLITWSMGTAGNDLQLCLYTLLGVHACLRWREDPARIAWLSLAGILGGYAVGSKWSGLLGTFVQIGAILLFSAWFARACATRKGMLLAVARPLIAFGMGVLIGCVPCFLRLYYLTENPVYPNLAGVFDSPFPTGSVVAGSPTERLGPASLLATIIDSLRLQTQYRALLGPLFIFMVPVLLVTLFAYRRPQRAIQHFLLGFLGLWLILWYAISNLELRYAETIVPILAIVISGALVNVQIRRFYGRFVQSQLLVMVGLMIALNASPLVPLQKSSTVPGAFAQPRIAWNYLYNGASEESVQLAFIPMIQYINGHLSPSRDKVYDSSGLILYTSYSNVPLYSGTRAINGILPWDLFNQDAIAHLRQIGASYVSLTSVEVAMLQTSAIGGCLLKVHETPDDQQLFRIEYERVVDPARSLCR